MASDDGDKTTEFGDDRVFNDLRYTINSDKLHALGWTEVGGRVLRRRSSVSLRVWTSQYIVVSTETSGTQTIASAKLHA